MKMFDKKISLALFSLLLVGCGQVESTPVSATDISSERVEVSQTLKGEHQVWLDAINEARAQVRDCHDGQGSVGPSAPLRWNDYLYDSAYEHSYDLAMSDTFSHYGSGTEYDVTSDDGEPSYFYERIEANGYSDFHHLGENIAGGQESIQEVMEAWLNSPGHCANIMSDKFSEVGMALVIQEGTRFETYWTQNFGG